LPSISWSTSQPSVTKSQNAFPISAEGSLNIPSTILPSDTYPEEITFSRLLKKIIPVPKTMRKCSNVKIASLFFINEEANNIEEKPKNQRGNIKSQSTDI
jgi:hypothetical protein